MAASSMQTLYLRAARTVRNRSRYILHFVVTVALSAAACLVAAAVASAVFFRDLPFGSADRLVWLSSSNLWERDAGTSIPAVRRWREESTTLAHVSGYTVRRVQLGDAAEPTVGRAAYVTADFFETLQVRPALGRVIGPADDQSGTAPVAVVSDALWRDQLGRRPNVVGSAIAVDGMLHEIIGVAPRGFTFPGEHTDVWLPYLQRFGALEHAEGAHIVFAIGRLRRGHTAQQAQTEIRQLEQWSLDQPSTQAEYRPFAESLREYLTRDIRPRVTVLVGAALLMLMLGCANLGNMFIAEMLRGKHQYAIQLILGAQRRALLWHRLLETCALVLTGICLGIVLARFVISIAARYAFDGIPEVSLAAIGARELGAAAALGLIMVGALMLVAFLQLRAIDVASAVRGGGRTQSTGRGEARRRDALVTLEIAATVVLLASAGVLAMSFVSLARTRLGFDPDDVYVASTPRPIMVFTPTEAGPTRRFVAALLAELTSTAGVDAAAVSTESPAAASRMYATIKPPGELLQLRASVLAVTPSYFELLHIPLRRGRLLSVSDDREGQEEDVGVVDERLARAVFGDADPIGRMLKLESLNRSLRVVGVVGDVRQGGGTTQEVAQVYVPYAALPLPWITVLVRSALSPGAVAAAMRQALVRADPQQPLMQFAPLTELLKDRLDRSLFYTILLGCFSAVSLMLSAVGVYGVLSLLVMQRRREFGIRLCLGATSSRIVALVLGHILRLVLVGSSAGVVFTMLSARILTALLYGVEPIEPIVLGMCVLGVIAVATIASWGPVRSVARLQPAFIVASE
jgi:putative ABC transport system permease protein